jgi:hypothetical protein
VEVLLGSSLYHISMLLAKPVLKGIQIIHMTDSVLLPARKYTDVSLILGQVMACNSP